MNRLGLFVIGLALSWATHSILACCAVSRPGKVVVNADQTVLMIYNPKTQTQHFIRQASFKSDANDVGFLVPSPSKPELAETDQAVFKKLKQITAPPEPPAAPLALGTTKSYGANRAPKPVEVLEQKRVAGYDASVLKADSGEALIEWLKNNNYDYSEAVAAWAKPYIEQKWIFTALKVAPKEAGEEAKPKDLHSPGLRISFKTDKPLFPYREPKSAAGAEKLSVRARTLQIFFIGETRYAGVMDNSEAWSGKSVWANKLSAEDVKELVKTLKIPADAMPANPWLTEFEDNWAYDKAKSDLKFLPMLNAEPLSKSAFGTNWGFRPSKPLNVKPQVDPDKIKGLVPAPKESPF